jgi:hypothetical protein
VGLGHPRPDQIHLRPIHALRAVTPPATRNRLAETTRPHLHAHSRAHLRTCPPAPAPAHALTRMHPRTHAYAHTAACGCFQGLFASRGLKGWRLGFAAHTRFRFFMKTPNEKWMLGQSLDNQVWHGTAWQAWAWAWAWAWNVRPLHGESCDVQRAASPCDANVPCGVRRAACNAERWPRAHRPRRSQRRTRALTDAARAHTRTHTRTR